MSTAGKGRDPRGEEGDRKRRSPHGCGSGNRAASASHRHFCRACFYAPHPHISPQLISSPRGHACWLGPGSPSCFWVEGLRSPLSSDTSTGSRTEPRLCPAALCVGSGADAVGIAALPSSSCLLHLGQGADALWLHLIRCCLLLPPPHNVPAGTVLCPEGSCDPGSWKDAREGECSPEPGTFGSGPFLPWSRCSHPQQGWCRARL